MHFIIWLIVGALAGFVAGKIVSGHGYGILVDLVVGIIGAVIGGFIATSLLGIAVTNLLVQFVVAVVGAVILLAILKAITGSRRRTTTY